MSVYIAGDDEGMQVPPCPLVMLISSDGVLLSYSAISLRSEHQNINRHAYCLKRIHEKVYHFQRDIFFVLDLHIIKKFCVSFGGKEMAN